MESQTIGYIFLLVMIIMLLSGVHLAITLWLVGFVGYLSIAGISQALTIMGTIPFGETNIYSFTTLPLFIIMGTFAYSSGIAEAAYNALYKWVNKLPGGLGVATCLGCAFFGAVSGSTTAAAAVFSKLSFPAMMRYNYDRRFAVGTIASAGTFASLIPPSGLLIVYAILTEGSVAKLFMAGLIPGLITMLLYSLFIIGRVLWNPKLAPRSKEHFTWREKVTSLPSLLPILFLFSLVMGGLYFGVFTPTEGGAVGALGALIIGMIAKRKILDVTYLDGLKEASHITAMILLIIIGAMMLSRFLAISRIPTMLAETVGQLPVSPEAIMFIFVLMYFLMGMVVSATGMMAVTLPVIAPLVVNLGYDLVWFGIVMIKLCEIAVVTPPVGVNLYAVKGVLGDKVSLEDIALGIYPFIVCDLAVLILIIFFPQIVLFLPNMLFS